MRTTPNLGLKVWDSPSDEFNPVDLEDNWDAIDADASSARPASRVEKLDDDLALVALPTLTNTAADIGRLIYLDIPVTGYDTHTIVRWNGTTWRQIGQPAIMGSLPTTANYQGRLVALTGASGGFAANDLVINIDGANGWKKIGGVASGAVLPGSPAAGDLFLLTAAAGGFDAYSLVSYNGSAWARTEKRGVEVGAALPGSPFQGQVFVVTAATGNFKANDVVRYNGSAWHKVGPGLIFVDNTAFSALTPIDGMEVIYQVDTTSGVNWHLRYNAGSASAYKWEFVGGSPIHVTHAGTNSGAGSGVWSDNADLVTLNRSGEYFITLHAVSGGNAAAATSYVSVGVDTQSVTVTLSWNSPGEVTDKALVTVAGDRILDLYHQDADSTRRINSSEVWVSIIPKRIS